MSGGAERVAIERIAAGGAGVGRLPDGRVVFVHRTAPGDVVEVELTRAKKRWARARVVRLIEPSAERREPPCPHYDRCGGCTLEHLTYDAQLRAKAALVGDALERIGGVTHAAPPITPSPRELRYRNRVSFTLVRHAGGVAAGFHELEQPGRVFDVTGECLLPEAPIARAWDALRAAWGPSADLLPPGPSLRLTLRASRDGRVALLVENGTGPGDPETLLARVPGLVSIWHRVTEATSAEHLAGDATLREQWQDEEIDVGGAAFLQVNREAAELLERHVLALVGEPAGRTVVDAYCGVGLHTRRLARAGARVTGIELDPGACREARAACAGLDATIVEGRVEDHIAGTLPADVAIVNPPRAGLDERVSAALAAAPPAKLVYVSCDPATLARDIARLEGALTLASVRCYDLFPQTSHVETVAELTCFTT